MSTFILLLLLAWLGSMLVLYFTRGTVIKRVRMIKDGAELPTLASQEFDTTFKLLTGTLLYQGNKLEPLLNGNGTFPRLWDDLQDARTVIFMHGYYVRPGRVAERAREILIERARGCQGIPSAGCRRCLGIG